MLDDDRTHDAVGNTEDTLKLEREARCALELYENVITLVLVIDRISELALAPLTDSLDGSVRRDKTGELLNKCLNRVVSLFDINDEQSFIGRNDFHSCYTSSWTSGPIHKIRIYTGQGEDTPNA